MCVDTLFTGSFNAILFGKSLHNAPYSCEDGLLSKDAFFSIPFESVSIFFARGGKHTRIKNGAWPRINERENALFGTAVALFCGGDPP